MISPDGSPVRAGTQPLKACGVVRREEKTQKFQQVIGGMRPATLYYATIYIQEGIYTSPNPLELSNRITADQFVETL